MSQLNSSSSAEWREATKRLVIRAYLPEVLGRGDTMTACQYAPRTSATVSLSFAAWIESRPRPVRKERWRQPRLELRAARDERSSLKGGPTQCDCHIHERIVAAAGPVDC